MRLNEEKVTIICLLYKKCLSLLKWIPRRYFLSVIIEFRKTFLSKNAYAAHATEADKPEECILLQTK